MNALNKSISGILNGKKGINPNLSECYLINNFAGSKEFYIDLFKIIETQKEINNSSLPNNIDEFFLGQTLPNAISKLAKEYYVLHRISEKVKIVKYVKNHKKIELRGELHFFNNQLFLISFCFIDLEKTKTIEILHHLFPNISDLTILNLNIYISNKSDILITEDKLLYKVSLLNKSELITCIKESNI
jgi:hypothetical protein